MLLGNEIGRIYAQRIDLKYASAETIEQRNRRINRALRLAVRQRYREANLGPISHFVTTGKALEVTNGFFYIRPLPVTITQLSPTSVQIATLDPHNVEAGDIVTLQDIIGITPAINGTQVVVSTPTPNSFVITVPAITAFAPIFGSVIPFNAIGDFDFLASLKCTNLKRLEKGGEQSTYISTGAAARIKFYRLNALRTGDKIRITGSTGGVSIDGDYYVKMVGSKLAELYSDEKLNVPVAPVAGVITVGQVDKLIANVATPIEGPQKVSGFYHPDSATPQYEFSGNKIKLIPEADSVEIDYINTGLLLIDIANTTIDYSVYIPMQTIDLIMDIVNEDFRQTNGDLRGAQMAAQTTIRVNP